VKLKIRVSDDISCFEERMAFVQVLDWRKMSRGGKASEGTSSPFRRMAQEAASKEPI